jgi:D-alanine--poly(phosphoribitol) ligase subunit 1
VSQGSELASSSVLRDIIDRARVQPEHPAVSDLNRDLNYAQLIDEVARVGAGLSERGVLEGDRIALFISNSVDFVVAALASLWVGAMFVPLAVTDPESRVASVVVDCTPALIVTSALDDESLLAPLVDVKSVSVDLLRQEGRAPVIERNPDARGAYMIYTSGTTGTPKGVQIGNAAFVAAVRSTASALGLGRDTRTLCVSPFHFDGSYANLFSTLVVGGTVIIRPRDALLFPRTFFHTVVNEGVTYSGFTPSYLRLLLASSQISSLGESTLEVIALGGETCSFADLRVLWSQAPSMRVFNRYGPTETTIAVTNVELTPEMINNGPVTIGRPHAGVSFFLLDENRHVIEAANQIGELYIGGVQLMDGYWRDPSLTEEMLRDDDVPGERLYRTGDLVYRDELGNYFFVDRAGQVIKRSGVRISLVELSASMNSLEGVISAVCLTFDREGELGIVAFVTTNVQFSSVDLRRAASTVIPENMLPDQFRVIEAMPLNRSNTLDESRLLLEAGLRPYRPTGA